MYWFWPALCHKTEKSFHQIGLEISVLHFGQQLKTKYIQYVIEISLTYT